MPENNNILKKEEELKFIDFIEKQVKEHPVVKEHHVRWKELIEWENGDQFSEWNETTHKMSPVKLTKRVKRVVVNLMKPLTEAIEGKINFTSMLAGMPNSSDMNDIAASKIATNLLGHNDYVNNNENLNEEIKYDLIRTGNAWRKWTWDKEAVAYTKKEEKDGDTLTTKPSQIKGDVVGVVPSVFNIRPDPTAKNRDEMRWLIEIAEVTEQSILDNFDIKKEELDAATGESKSPDDKYAGMYEKTDEKDKDELTHIVKYYWEKSSKKYPEGRHIICVGRLILWKGANPCLGEIPYFHYGYKRYGNSLWHTGPLHHVQPIQREYNRMVSIISEHIESWKPKVLAGPGAIIKEGAYTTDNCEIVEVDFTKGEPRPMNVPELSSQVLAHRDFLANALNTVANVHEVSYSQLPEHATRAPASLYSMMLEQENLKIDPMIKRINKSLIEEGRFRLRLMEKYYKTDRLVKIVGKANEASISYFKGADLKGNTDVKLSVGVSIHQSKVVQQRLLLELKQQGAPIDWNKIFKLIGEGDIEQELRGDIADETKAQRENQSFIHDDYGKTPDKGGVSVYLHDNHELHMDYHTNLRKTEEAQGWAADKLAALDAHVDEHFQYILALKQTQAETGAVGGGGVSPTGETAPGTPPGPGLEGGQSPESGMTEGAATI